MNTKTASSGSPLFGLLLVLFVALKLTGVISWSWWWVTAPLWGPVALFVVILLIFLLIVEILKV